MNFEEYNGVWEAIGQTVEHRYDVFASKDLVSLFERVTEYLKTVPKYAFQDPVIEFKVGYTGLYIIRVYVVE